jgi:hypothetical protein
MRRHYLEQRIIPRDVINKNPKFKVRKINYACQTPDRRACNVDYFYKCALFKNFDSIKLFGKPVCPDDTVECVSVSLKKMNQVQKTEVAIDSEQKTVYLNRIPDLQDT